MIQLNTMNELCNVMTYASSEGISVGLYINVPNCDAPELIINPPVNLQEKLGYYQSVYNEDLTHKKAPGVDILAYTYEIAGYEDEIIAAGMLMDADIVAPISVDVATNNVEVFQQAVSILKGVISDERIPMGVRQSYATKILSIVREEE